MDLFNFKTPLTPAPGRLLVSEPLLPDPNFERSIVLLCAHDEDGSFGFVLNKPSLNRVGDIIEGLEELEQLAFIGGPVQQDTLHFIHRFPEIEGSKEILEGIYWGGDFDSVKELAFLGKCTPDRIRFFLGYSGWSEGQLEGELKENAWIVSNRVDHSLIFETDPGEMWRKAISFLGGRFLRYANYPTDPRLN